MQTLKISYDVFSEEWYKKVEEFVLGEFRFNEEQKKFIYYFNSSIIEAGPGSGKTTALAAKVALLLKKIEEEGSLVGVCVITHTNAAVDEILKVLKKLGYKDIPHPHFIGTIHSFFNKYLLPKIFCTEISNASLRFVERIPDWEYRKFIKQKNYWLSEGPLTNVLRRLKAVNYNIELFPFRVKTENTEAWDKYSNYKDTFNYAIRERITKGLLLHDDTLKITNQFLKQNEYIHKILTNRFQYVLVDEYQDTDQESLRQLINIYNNEENVIQLIGDLNQHIYYDITPFKKANMPTYRINITNRFGDKIINPLNRMFEGNLTAKDPNKSIKPILYLYKTPESLVMDYTEILNRHKIQFKRNMPNILVAEHIHAQHMKQKTSNVTQKNSKMNLQIALDEIYKIFVNRTNAHVQSIKSMLINEYKNYNIEINKSLIDYFRGDLNSLNKLKDSINSFLNALGATSQINLSNSLFVKIKSLKDLNDNVVKEDGSIIQTKTVHNVKGQTLKANMVYLAENSVEEYGFLDSYNMSLPRPDMYREIDKRVVYVAMSRATTHLVIALHENTYKLLTKDTRMKLREDFKILKSNKKIEANMIKSN